MMDIAAYVATAPQSCRGVLERALAGAASPRQAIKAKCLACTNWQRDEIAQCAVTLCPLHRYRPFQECAGTAQDCASGADFEQIDAQPMATPSLVAEGL